MTPLRRKRLLLVSTLMGGVGIAAGLILFAFSQNINLFYTPTQCAQGVPIEKTIRVGGMVVKDSVKRVAPLQVEFTITDFNRDITIHYKGILPDLFKEGQGVVAMGQFDAQQKFTASQVLAKHDEKYMPPEVAAMKLKGSS